MLVPGQQSLTVFCVLLWVLRPHPVFSGVVAGTGIVLSPGLTETKDHEMDGAGAGRSPRCDPQCGQRVGAESFVSELQDTMVPVSCAVSADVDGAASRTLVTTMFPSCMVSWMLLVIVLVFDELVGGGRFRLLCR